MAQLHTVLKKYGKGSLSDSEILRKVFEGEWKDAKAAKNKKDKEKAENTDDKHTPGLGELTAVLWKDSSYNANTYTHLKSDGGRNKVFSTFKYVDQAYGPSDWLPRFIKKYFKFPSDIKCNFNPNADATGQKTPGGVQKKAGQRYPYKWEAHHMIPAEAFYGQLETDSGSSQVFTPTQYALLLMSDYNINNGHNMIPLPTNGMDRYQPVHALIQHPSNHGNYTNKVQMDMKEISSDLESLEDEADKPHPEISVEIANVLDGLEDELWDLLLKLGDSIVKSQLNNVPADLSPEEQSLVKQQADSGTVYTYGALA